MEELTGSAAGSAKAGSRKLLRKPRAVIMVRECIVVGFT